MTNLFQLDKILILKSKKFATGIPIRYSDMSISIHPLLILACGVGLSSRGKPAQTVARGFGKGYGSLKMLFVMLMLWQNHQQGKDRSLCQLLPAIFWGC